MIGIGLIGAGFIGKVHGGCAGRHPGARLVAVHDLNPEAAAAVASKWGASVAGSADELLAASGVDAVIIAASTDAHGELARKCISSGMPFLCEKPIDRDHESAKETARAAGQRGVFAGMGFNRRYDRQYAMLKSAVDSGEIGRIEMMHVTSRTQQPQSLDYIRISGGQFRDKGAHFFDLAAWISGERLQEIYAVGDCLIDPRFADYGDVDTAMAIGRLSGGGFCHFNFSRRTSYGYDERIEVFGSAGKIESRTPVPVDVVRYKGDRMHSSGIHQHWFDRFSESYSVQFDAFVKEIERPTGGFATINDGLAAEAAAEACMRSLESRRAVGIEFTD